MSRVGLLDVNVLVALAWPNHVGHAAARSWMIEQRAAGTGWATTPVTESGFVRVSSNRRVLPAVTTPAQSVTALQRLTALDGHEFWPDDVRGVMDPELTRRLRGHLQVTDAHLLTLAGNRGGRLITFDAALPHLSDAIPVTVLTA